LENPNDREVQQWSHEQNRNSRRILDQLPAREQIEKRLKFLYSSTSADYLGLQSKAGLIFALKWQPPKQQQFLVVLESTENLGSERVVFDPNQLDKEGTTSIDWYVPSPDGRYAAVSQSKGGSEEGSLHFYEVATGRELPDLISRVNYPTAGGSAAWNADATGVYYTRYPRSGERPAEDLNFYQQVYFHKLGTSLDEDSYVIGKDLPRIAEIKLESSEDGKCLLATVANGDGGEFAHYLMNASGSWTRLTRFSDQVTVAKLGRDGHVYLLDRRGTPRGRILKLPLSNPNLDQATTLVEEGKCSIDSFEPTANRLYVVETDGGPSLIQVYDLSGREQGGVPLEQVSSVEQIVRLRGDEILFKNESFIKPPAWYRYDPAVGKSKRTALAMTSAADFADCEVTREFATSQDGTKVPLNIIRRKTTKLNASNPTILTGYGGYGISVKPYFQVHRKIWLDQGGVIAVANLRGGGEYGEDWHKAGKLTRKQNVFDDFIACARHLIEAGYTNSSKLAIVGGSNGGLLMGAAFTQHPELFQAVASLVGIYDMLRVELDPNGAFNVTEFGTIKDPEQFKALYAYSPYHHVVDGTAYPAVLFLTGENDGRVNPAQSRKMTARLQSATSSQKPILLRTSSSSGHGVDSALNELIAEAADEYAFLLDQLKVDYKPVESA
jgi:prolyl oligopeptidase